MTPEPSFGDRVMLQLRANYLAIRDMPETSIAMAAKEIDDLHAREGKRPCTCHPDDNPPVPCAEKYALSECKSTPTPAQPQGEWRLEQSSRRTIGIALNEAGFTDQQAQQHFSNATASLNAELAAMRAEVQLWKDATAHENSNRNVLAAKLDNLQTPSLGGK